MPHTRRRFPSPAPTPDGPGPTSLWLERLVPEGRYATLDALRRARILSVGVALLVLVGLGRGSLLLFQGSATGALVLVAAIVFGVLTGQLLRRGASLTITGNILVAGLFATCTAATVLRGGVGSPVTTGAAAAILLAVMTAGLRSGIAWTAATLATVLALHVAETRGVLPPAGLGSDEASVLDLSATLVIPAVTLGIAAASERTKQAPLREHLAAERGRQTALQQAALAEADRMAAIGTLAAGVGHEINNPLSYVSGNLQLLTDPDEYAAFSDTERLDLLRDATEGAEQIRNVVRDLMIFARAEDDDNARIGVAEAVRGAARLARHGLRHRASVELDLDDDACVRGSAHRLTQVFMNLLINAARASEDGQPGQVRVRVHHSEGTVIATVADNGCGIPEANLERIFEPFFTTRAPGQGTGLGLAVCRGIVEGMGGSLGVRSRPGDTEFELRLPEADEPAHRAKDTDPLTPAAPSRRLLVVDDDPRVGRATARLLSRHTVEVVHGGEAALDRIRRPPALDLVVSDLVMPGLDGIGLLHAATEATGHEGPAFLFVTGGVPSRALAEAVEQSGVTLLQKPLRKNNLEAAIERSIASRHPSIARGSRHGEPD